MPVRFEWDENKDRANIQKHGVGFDEAKWVFIDPNVLVRDDRVGEGEERWHAIGYVDRVLLGSASFRRVKLHRRRGDCMKKASDKPGRTITRTFDQLEDRKPTERPRLKRLAALPDPQIDTSDIPEVKDRTGWVRVHDHPEHPLHRVLSRLLSIRLPEPDIALAQRLAAVKGLPYQTYIKSLLHEALEREQRAAADQPK